MSEYSMEEYRRMKSEHAKLNEKCERLEKELTTTKVVLCFYIFHFLLNMIHIHTMNFVLICSRPLVHRHDWVP